MSESKKSWLWVLSTIFLSALIGALGMYSFGPKKAEVQITKEQPIYIQGEAKHTQTNTVQYVKKERDPVTGEVEKTDAEYQIAQPKVTVKVNGQEADFDLLQGEKWKFEDGKLLFQQDSSIDFLFQVPSIDRTRRHGLSYGLRSDGNEALRYDQAFKDSRWGWYVGTDGKLIQKTIKGDSMKIEHVEGGVRYSW